jgi:hypothetical protein
LGSETTTANCRQNAERISFARIACVTPIASVDGPPFGETGGTRIETASGRTSILTSFPPGVTPTSACFVTEIRIRPPFAGARHCGISRPRKARQLARRAERSAVAPALLIR